MTQPDFVRIAAALVSSIAALATIVIAPKKMTPPRMAICVRMVTPPSVWAAVGGRRYDSGHMAAGRTRAKSAVDSPPTGGTLMKEPKSARGVRPPRPFDEFSKIHPAVTDAYERLGEAVRAAGPLTER